MVPAEGRALVGTAGPLVVDLDRDGHQDVVALLQTSPVPTPPLLVDLADLKTNLYIFWGNGEATFSMQGLDVETGFFYSRHLAAGDFDNNGLLDLAYPDIQTVSIHIFYNRSERRLDGPHLMSVSKEGAPCIPAPLSICAADMDETREGEDIVVVGLCVSSREEYTCFVRVLLSCEEGCWELLPLIMTGATVVSPADLMGGDFNADGHMDVVFTQCAVVREDHDELTPLHFWAG